MTQAVVLLVALVAEDPAVLRNAPRDNAPAQATLWRGDWLEVRGESAGFLKVYDHRHERPGYVRPSQVRLYRVDESSDATFRALVEDWVIAAEGDGSTLTWAFAVDPQPDLLELIRGAREVIGEVFLRAMESLAVHLST